MLKRIFTLLFFMLIFSSVAVAQEKVNLDTIEVKEQKQTVRKITQDEIDRIDASNLWDALRLSSGIQLTTSGGRNDYSINVRGFDSRQVPLYIDGVPVYIPYDGYADLARILPFDLESIELSKGYSSVLLGGNTIGGAINLRTAKPQKKLEFSMKFLNDFDRGFSNQGQNYFVSIGSRLKYIYMKASYSGVQENFFTVSKSYKTAKSEPDGKRRNSAIDDKKLTLELGVMPTTFSEISLKYIYQYAKKEQPLYVGNYGTTKFWRWPNWSKQSIVLNGKTEITKDGYISATAYYDTYSNTLEMFDDATFTTQNKKNAGNSVYDDYTYGVMLEGGYKINDMHALKAGAQYKFDSHKSFSKNIKDSAYEDGLQSYSLEYTLTPIKPVSIVFGGSYNRLTPFLVEDLNLKSKNPAKKGNSVDAFNGQVGVFYDINKENEIFLTFALKTRMPTLKDRYSYRLGSAIPNPDLKSEQAFHYEIGYRGEFSRISTVVSAYFSDVKNMIAPRNGIDPADPKIYQQQNIGKVYYYGADFEMKALIHTMLSAGAVLSYMEWKNKSNNLKLLFRPTVVTSLYAIFAPLDVLSFIPMGEYRSVSYTLSDGLKVKGFFLLHLKAVFDVSDEIALEAGVRNIFDQSYEYEEGYPMPGRTYFVAIKGKF